MDIEQLGIHKVRIPLPFRLDHVNCYLARGANGWSIIDAGLGYAMTKDAWEKVFLEKGIQPTDIEQVFLTHHHPDHYGFLGQLQNWTGADIYASRASKQLTQTSWSEKELQRMKSNYLRSGVPKELADRMDKHNLRIATEWVTPHAKINHIVKENDIFQFGTLKYKALHTPGHASGHMVLWNEEHRVMLGGDHVLQKITPNISFRLTGNDNPLNDYLESLHQIEKLNVDYILPGHGEPFENASKRIRELITHHYERLEQLMEILNENTEFESGKKTAYQICKKMFNRDLDEHAIRPAIGETLSHLQYMIHYKWVVVEETTDVLYFSPSSSINVKYGNSNKFIRVRNNK